MTTKANHSQKLQALVAPQFAVFDMSERAVDAGEASLDSMPLLPALPQGGAFGRDGRGPFTWDVAEVVSNIRANGADIPVFVDHQSGKAYGWLSHKASPTVQADGSLEWPVEYTDEGRALVLSKAYRYNSPTLLFFQDETVKGRQAGRVVGIQENSLTNLPNLPFRALNNQETGGSYTGEQSVSPTAVKPMTPEQLALLGLTAEATAEQITEALTALSANAARATAIVEAAGAPADAEPAAVVEAAANSRVTSGALVSKQAFDEVVTARDAALAAQSAAEAALGALKAEQAQAAAQAAEVAAVAAVDEAIAAGKYTPGVRELCLQQARADLATFKAIAAGLPSRVEGSVATQAVQGDETHGLSTEQLAKCEQLGIKPAEYAKALRAAKAAS